MNFSGTTAGPPHQATPAVPAATQPTTRSGHGLPRHHETGKKNDPATGVPSVAIITRKIPYAVQHRAHGPRRGR